MVSFNLRSKYGPSISIRGREFIVNEWYVRPIDNKFVAVHTMGADEPLLTVTTGDMTSKCYSPDLKVGDNVVVWYAPDNDFVSVTLSRHMLQFYDRGNVSCWEYTLGFDWNKEYDLTSGSPIYKDGAPVSCVTMSDGNGTYACAGTSIAKGIIYGKTLIVSSPKTTQRLNPEYFFEQDDVITRPNTVHIDLSGKQLTVSENDATGAVVNTVIVNVPKGLIGTKHHSQHGSSNGWTWYPHKNGIMCTDGVNYAVPKHVDNKPPFINNSRAGDILSTTPMAGVTNNVELMVSGRTTSFNVMKGAIIHYDHVDDMVVFYKSDAFRCSEPLPSGLPVFNKFYKLCSLVTKSKDSELYVLSSENDKVFSVRAANVRRETVPAGGEVYGDFIGSHDQCLLHKAMAESTAEKSPNDEVIIYDYATSGKTTIVQCAGNREFLRTDFSNVAVANVEHNNSGIPVLLLLLTSCLAATVKLSGVSKCGVNDDVDYPATCHDGSWYQLSSADPHASRSYNQRALDFFNGVKNVKPVTMPAPKAPQKVSRCGNQNSPGVAAQCVSGKWVPVQSNHVLQKNGFYNELALDRAITENSANSKEMFTGTVEEVSLDPNVSEMIKSIFDTLDTRNGTVFFNRLRNISDSHEKLLSKLDNIVASDTKMLTKVNTALAVIIEMASVPVTNTTGAPSLIGLGKMTATAYLKKHKLDRVEMAKLKSYYDNIFAKLNKIDVENFSPETVGMIKKCKEMVKSLVNMDRMNNDLIVKLEEQVDKYTSLIEKIRKAHDSWEDVVEKLHQATLVLKSSVGVVRRMAEILETQRKEELEYISDQIPLDEQSITQLEATLSDMTAQIEDTELTIKILKDITDSVMLGDDASAFTQSRTLLSKKFGHRSIASTLPASISCGEEKIVPEISVRSYTYSTSDGSRISAFVNGTLFNCVGDPSGALKCVIQRLISAQVLAHETHCNCEANVTITIEGVLFHCGIMRPVVDPSVTQEENIHTVSHISLAYFTAILAILAVVVTLAETRGLSVAVAFFILSFYVMPTQADCVLDAHIYEGTYISKDKGFNVYRVTGNFHHGNCFHAGNSTITVERISQVVPYEKIGSNYMLDYSATVVSEYGCPGGKGKDVWQMVKPEITAPKLCSIHEYKTQAVATAWTGTNCALDGELYFKHWVTLCSNVTGSIYKRKSNIIDKSITVKVSAMTSEYIMSSDEENSFGNISILGMRYSSKDTPEYILHARGVHIPINEAQFLSINGLAKNTITKYGLSIIQEGSQISIVKNIPGIWLDYKKGHVKNLTSSYDNTTSFNDDSLQLISRGLVASGSIEVRDKADFDESVWCMQSTISSIEVAPGDSFNYRASKILLIIPGVKLGCKVQISCKYCMDASSRWVLQQNKYKYEKSVLCGVLIPSNCSVLWKDGETSFKVTDLARNPMLDVNWLSTTIQSNINSNGGFQSVGRVFSKLYNSAMKFVSRFGFDLPKIFKTVIIAFILIIALRQWTLGNKIIAVALLALCIIPVATGQQCAVWHSDSKGMQVPKLLHEHKIQSVIHGVWNLPSIGKLDCNRTETCDWLTNANLFEWFSISPNTFGSPCGSVVEEYCKHGAHYGYKVKEYFDFINLCYHHLCPHTCRDNSTHNVLEQTCGLTPNDVRTGCKNNLPYTFEEAAYNLPAYCVKTVFSTGSPVNHHFLFLVMLGLIFMEHYSSLLLLFFPCLHLFTSLLGEIVSCASENVQIIKRMLSCEWETVATFFDTVIVIIFALLQTATTFPVLPITLLAYNLDSLRYFWVLYVDGREIIPSFQHTFISCFIADHWFLRSTVKPHIYLDVTHKRQIPENAIFVNYVQRDAKLKEKHVDVRGKGDLAPWSFVKRQLNQMSGPTHFNVNINYKGTSFFASKINNVVVAPFHAIRKDTRAFVKNDLISSKPHRKIKWELYTVGTDFYKSHGSSGHLMIIDDKVLMYQGLCGIYICDCLQHDNALYAHSDNGSEAGASTSNSDNRTFEQKQKDRIEAWSNIKKLAPKKKNKNPTPKVPVFGHQLRTTSITYTENGEKKKIDGFVHHQMITSKLSNDHEKVTAPERTMSRADQASKIMASIKHNLLPIEVINIMKKHNTRVQYWEKLNDRQLPCTTRYVLQVSVGDNKELSREIAGWADNYAKKHRITYPEKGLARVAKICDAAIAEKVNVATVVKAESLKKKVQTVKTKEGYLLKKIQHMRRNSDFHWSPERQGRKSDDAESTHSSTVSDWETLYDPDHKMHSPRESITKHLQEDDDNWNVPEASTSRISNTWASQQSLDSESGPEEPVMDEAGLLDGFDMDTEISEATIYPVSDKRCVGVIHARISMAQFAKRIFEQYAKGRVDDYGKLIHYADAGKAFFFMLNHIKAENIRCDHMDDDMQANFKVFTDGKSDFDEPTSVQFWKLLCYIMQYDNWQEGIADSAKYLQISSFLQDIKYTGSMDLLDDFKHDIIITKQISVVAAKKPGDENSAGLEDLGRILDNERRVLPGVISAFGLCTDGELLESIADTWLLSSDYTYVFKFRKEAGFGFIQLGAFRTCKHVLHEGALSIGYSSIDNGKGLSADYNAKKYKAILKLTSEVNQFEGDLLQYNLISSPAELCKPMPSNIYFVINPELGEVITLRYDSDVNRGTNETQRFRLFRHVSISKTGEISTIIRVSTKFCGWSGLPILGLDGKAYGIWGTVRKYNVTGGKEHCEMSETLIPKTTQLFNDDSAVTQIDLRIGEAQTTSKRIHRITAPTGFGKSTRLPIALLRKSKKVSKIWVVVPTRSAAKKLFAYVREQVKTSSATRANTRVELYLGGKIKESNDVKSSKCITYSTYGYLIHHIKSLTADTLLIMDEIHTRNSGDVLALEHWVSHTSRYGFTLAMTATIFPHPMYVDYSIGKSTPKNIVDKKLYQKDTGDCVPIKYSDTVTYYLPPSEIEGSNTMIFYAGVPQAQKAVDALNKAGKTAFVIHAGTEIEPTYTNAYLCCTDVVEAAVTIPNTTRVVDFQENFKPVASLDADKKSISYSRQMTLMTINKTSKEQRRGRTGRDCSGEYWTAPVETMLADVEVYPVDACIEAAMLLLKTGCILPPQEFAQSESLITTFAGILSPYNVLTSAWGRGKDGQKYAYEMPAISEELAASSEVSSCGVLFYLMKYIPTNLFECELHIHASSRDKFAELKRIYAHKTVSEERFKNMDCSFSYSHELLNILNNENADVPEVLGTWYTKQLSPRMFSGASWTIGAIGVAASVSAVGLLFGQLFSKWHGDKHPNVVYKIPHGEITDILNKLKYIDDTNWDVCENTIFGKIKSGIRLAIKSVCNVIRKIATKLPECRLKEFLNWLCPVDNPKEFSGGQWEVLWNNVTDQFTALIEDGELLDKITLLAPAGLVPFVGIGINSMVESFGELSTFVILSSLTTLAAANISTLVYGGLSLATVLGYAVKNSVTKPLDTFGTPLLLALIGGKAIATWVIPALTGSVTALDLVGGVTIVNEVTMPSLMPTPGGVGEGFKLVQQIIYLFERGQNERLSEKLARLLSLSISGISASRMSYTGWIGAAVTAGAYFVVRALKRQNHLRHMGRNALMRNNDMAAASVMAGSESEIDDTDRMISQMYSIVIATVGSALTPASIPIAIYKVATTYFLAGNADVTFEDMLNMYADTVVQDPTIVLIQTTLGIFSALGAGEYLTFFDGQSSYQKFIMKSQETIKGCLDSFVKLGTTVKDKTGNGLNCLKGKMPDASILSEFLRTVFGKMCTFWDYISKWFAKIFISIKGFFQQRLKEAVTSAFLPEALSTWLSKNKPVVQEDFNPHEIPTEAKLRKFINAYGFTSIAALLMPGVKLHQVSRIATIPRNIHEVKTNKTSLRIGMTMGTTSTLCALAESSCIDRRMTSYNMTAYAAWNEFLDIVYASFIQNPKVQINGSTYGQNIIGDMLTRICHNGNTLTGMVLTRDGKWCHIVHLHDLTDLSHNASVSSNFMTPVGNQVSHRGLIGDLCTILMKNKPSLLGSNLSDAPYPHARTVDWNDVMGKVSRSIINLTSKQFDSLANCLFQPNYLDSKLLNKRTSTDQVDTMFKYLGLDGLYHFSSPFGQIPCSIARNFLQEMRQLSNAPLTRKENEEVDHFVVNSDFKGVSEFTQAIAKPSAPHQYVTWLSLVNCCRAFLSIDGKVLNNAPRFACQDCYVLQDSDGFVRRHTCSHCANNSIPVFLVTNPHFVKHEICLTNAEWKKAIAQNGFVTTNTYVTSKWLDCQYKHISKDSTCKAVFTCDGIEGFEKLLKDNKGSIDRDYANHTLAYLFFQKDGEEKMSELRFPIKLLEKHRITGLKSPRPSPIEKQLGSGCVLNVSKVIETSVCKHETDFIVIHHDEKTWSYIENLAGSILVSTPDADDNTEVCFVGDRRHDLKVRFPHVTKGVNEKDKLRVLFRQAVNDINIKYNTIGTRDQKYRELIQKAYAGDENRVIREAILGCDENRFALDKPMVESHTVKVPEREAPALLLGDYKSEYAKTLNLSYFPWHLIALTRTVQVPYEIYFNNSIDPRQFKRIMTDKANIHKTSLDLQKINKGKKPMGLEHPLPLVGTIEFEVAERARHEKTHGMSHVESDWSMVVGEANKRLYTNNFDTSLHNYNQCKHVKVDEYRQFLESIKTEADAQKVAAAEEYADTVDEIIRKDSKPKVFVQQSVSKLKRMLKRNKEAMPILEEPEPGCSSEIEVAQSIVASELRYAGCASAPCSSTSSINSDVAELEATISEHSLERCSPRSSTEDLDTNDDTEDIPLYSCGEETDEEEEECMYEYQKRYGAEFNSNDPKWDTPEEAASRPSAGPSKLSTFFGKVKTAFAKKEETKTQEVVYTKVVNAKTSTNIEELDCERDESEDVVQYTQVADRLNPPGYVPPVDHTIPVANDVDIAVSGILAPDHKEYSKASMFDKLMRAGYSKLTGKKGEVTYTRLASSLNEAKRSGATMKPSIDALATSELQMRDMLKGDLARNRADCSVVNFGAYMKRSCVASTYQDNRLNPDHMLPEDLINIENEVNALSSGYPIMFCHKQEHIGEVPVYSLGAQQKLVYSATIKNQQKYDMVKRLGRVDMPSSIEFGVASRAYFKAAQIDRQLGILSSANNILDLSCGAGGFAQYCTTVTKSPSCNVLINTLTIAGSVKPALDILLRCSKKHSITINSQNDSNDIRDKRTHESIKRWCDTRNVDLIMFDGGERNQSLVHEDAWITAARPIVGGAKQTMEKTVAKALPHYFKMLRKGGKAIIMFNGFGAEVRKTAQSYIEEFNGFICWRSPSTPAIEREWYLILTGYNPFDPKNPKLFGHKENQANNFTNVLNKACSQWYENLTRWHQATKNLNKPSNWPTEEFRQSDLDRAKTSEKTGLLEKLKQAMLKIKLEHIKPQIKYYNGMRVYQMSYPQPTGQWVLPPSDLKQRAVTLGTKPNVNQIDDKFTVFGETFDMKITQRVQMVTDMIKTKKYRIYEPTGFFKNVPEIGRVNFKQQRSREKHHSNQLYGDMGARIYGLSTSNSVIGHTQRTEELLYKSWAKRLDIKCTEPAKADAEFLNTARKTHYTPEYRAIADGPDKNKFEPWSYDEMCEHINNQGRGGHFDDYECFKDAVASAEFKREFEKRMRDLDAGKALPTYITYRDKAETKGKKTVDETGRLVIDDPQGKLSNEEMHPTHPRHKRLNQTERQKRREERKEILRNAANIMPRGIQLSEFVMRACDLAILGPVQQYHNHVAKLYMGSTTGTPLWQLGDLVKAVHDAYVPLAQREWMCAQEKKRAIRLHLTKDFLQKQKNVLAGKDLHGQKQFENLILCGDFSGYDGTITKTDLVLNFLTYKDIYKQRFHKMLKTRFEHYLMSIVITDDGHIIITDGQRKSGDQDTSFGNTDINDIYHTASTALALCKTCEEVNQIIGWADYRVKMIIEDQLQEKFKRFYLRMVTHIADGDDNLHFGNYHALKAINKDGSKFLERCGKRIRCGEESGYSEVSHFEKVQFCSHTFIRTRIGNVVDKSGGTKDLIPVNLVDYGLRPPQLHTFREQDQVWAAEKAAAKTTTDATLKRILKEAGFNTEDAQSIMSKVGKSSLPYQHDFDVECGLTPRYLPYRPFSQILGKFVFTMKNAVTTMDYNRAYGQEKAELKRAIKNERAHEITRGKTLSYGLNYPHIMNVRYMTGATMAIIGDGACDLSELSKRYNVPSTWNSVHTGLRSVFGVKSIHEIETVSPDIERRELKIVRYNTQFEYEDCEKPGVGKVCPLSLEDNYRRHYNWVLDFASRYDVTPDLRFIEQHRPTTSMSQKLLMSQLRTINGLEALANKSGAQKPWGKGNGTILSRHEIAAILSAKQVLSRKTNSAFDEPKPVSKPSGTTTFLHSLLTIMTLGVIRPPTSGSFTGQKVMKKVFPVLERKLKETSHKKRLPWSDALLGTHHMVFFMSADGSCDRDTQRVVGSSKLKQIRSQKYDPGSIIEIEGPLNNWYICITKPNSRCRTTHKEIRGVIKKLADALWAMRKRRTTETSGKARMSAKTKLDICVFTRNARVDKWSAQDIVTEVCLRDLGNVFFTKYRN